MDVIIFFYNNEQNIKWYSYLQLLGLAFSDILHLLIQI